MVTRRARSQYGCRCGHALLGRRMPDLDLVTAAGTLRVFTLLHGARPVLLNLGHPGRLDIRGQHDFRENGPSPIRVLHRAIAFRSWRMMGRAGARRATTLNPACANAAAVPVKIFDVLFGALMSIG